LRQRKFELFTPLLHSRGSFVLLASASYPRGKATCHCAEGKGHESFKAETFMADGERRIVHIPKSARSRCLNAGNGVARFNKPNGTCLQLTPNFSWWLVSNAGNPPGEGPHRSACAFRSSATGSENYLHHSGDGRVRPAIPRRRRSMLRPIYARR